MINNNQNDNSFTLTSQLSEGWGWERQRLSDGRPGNLHRLVKKKENKQRP